MLRIGLILAEVLFASGSSIFSAGRKAKSEAPSAAKTDYPKTVETLDGAGINREFRAVSVPTAPLTGAIYFTSKFAFQVTIQKS